MRSVLFLLPSWTRGKQRCLHDAVLTPFIVMLAKASEEPSCVLVSTSVNVARMCARAFKVLFMCCLVGYHGGPS